MCSSLLLCFITTFLTFHDITTSQPWPQHSNSGPYDFCNYILLSFPTATIPCHNYKHDHTCTLGQLQCHLVPLPYLSFTFPTPFLDWLETPMTCTPQTILHLLFRFDCAHIPQQGISYWSPTCRVQVQISSTLVYFLHLCVYYISYIHPIFATNCHKPFL